MQGQEISVWLSRQDRYDAYIDIATSKTGSSRKNFTRMLDDCHSKNIDIVLTQSISRFGRDIVEVLDALKQLKALNVRVIFEQESLLSNKKHIGTVRLLNSGKYEFQYVSTDNNPAIIADKKFQAVQNTVQRNRININVWLSQKMIATLYNVGVNTINYHLKRLFRDGELDEKAVIRDFRITAQDGKNYNTKHYNLKATIAVGNKVDSPRALNSLSSSVVLFFILLMEAYMLIVSQFGKCL